MLKKKKQKNFSIYIKIYFIFDTKIQKQSNSKDKTNVIFKMINCIDDCSPTVVIQTIIQNLRRRRHQKNKTKVLKM